MLMLMQLAHSHRADESIVFDVFYVSSMVLQFQASVLVKDNSVKSKTIRTLLFLQPYV